MERLGGGGRDADRSGQKEGVCTALGGEMPSQREEKPWGATPWTTGGLAEPGAKERAKVPRSPLSPIPPPPTPGCIHPRVEMGVCGGGAVNHSGKLRETQALFSKSDQIRPQTPPTPC